MRIPLGTITFVVGESPFRGTEAEIVAYDSEKIEDGIDNGLRDALIAQASSGLAEILDDVYGLDAGWCNDKQRFDTLMSVAIKRWKNETLTPKSRLGLNAEINEHFCDYAMNIALQVWFIKMREAHGLSPQWE
jgi:hypothetical protein